MIRVLIAVAVAVMAMIGVTAPASASTSHHITQTAGGLTCQSVWHITYGGTTCTGNPSQRWRFHAACQAQSDYTGTWNWGAGSDGHECMWSITNASVQWG